MYYFYFFALATSASAALNSVTQHAISQEYGGYTYVLALDSQVPSAYATMSIEYFCSICPIEEKNISIDYRYSHFHLELFSFLVRFHNSRSTKYYIGLCLVFHNTIDLDILKNYERVCNKTKKRNKNTFIKSNE